MTTGNGTTAPDNGTGPDEPQVTFASQVTVKIGLPEDLAIALHGHSRKLKDELRAVANELKETATPDTKHVLTGKAEAFQLLTVIEYLHHDPEIRESDIIQPLIHLSQRLLNQIAGAHSDAHLAQGVLVVAYMALERVKWKPAVARQWLDEELRDRGMREMVCGQNIQRWHNQYTAPSGLLAPMVVKTIKDYQAELLSLQDEAEAQAFARKCLETVRWMGLERIRLQTS